MIRCNYCGGATIVTNTYSFEHPNNPSLDVIVRARKCGCCDQYLVTVEQHNKDLSLSAVRELYKKKKED